MNRGVVLVEDNPDISYLFVQVLEIHGINVCATFESVEAALRYGAWKHVAVCLTDYSLGHGMNGTELLAWLSANHPSITRVLVSAHPLGEIKNQNRNLEPGLIQEFVQKPFNTESITSLKKILGYDGGDNEL